MTQNIILSLRIIVWSTPNCSKICCYMKYTVTWIVSLFVPCCRQLACTRTAVGLIITLARQMNLEILTALTVINDSFDNNSFQPSLVW